MKAEADWAATSVAAKRHAPAEPAATDGAAHHGDGLAALPADRLTLHRGPTGVLRATIGGPAGRSYRQVAVYRAFPLSDACGWVVLLDARGEEIGTLRDPSALAPDSAAILAEELELRYLTPRVEAVRAISEDASEGGGWSPALVWDLDTDRGPLRLRLPNLADHVRPIGARRYLITDRDGRRAEIADAAALPPGSRAWLRRYLWL